jgi:hypothetical protein
MWVQESTIAFLSQVRCIFKAETLAGQEIVVPHEQRKRYIGSSPLTKSYNLCCERVGDSATSALLGTN